MFGNVLCLVKKINIFTFQDHFFHVAVAQNGFRIKTLCSFFSPWIMDEASIGYIHLQANIYLSALMHLMLAISSFFSTFAQVRTKEQNLLCYMEHVYMCIIQYIL